MTTSSMTARARQDFEAVELDRQRRELLAAAKRFHDREFADSHAWVRDAEPLPSTERATRWGIAVACADLGVDPPEALRWFRPATADEYLAADDRETVFRGDREHNRYVGMAYRSNEVWVRWDLAPSDAAKTALHEVRHLWQFRVWPNPDEPSHDSRERDALAYEARFAAALEEKARSEQFFPASEWEAVATEAKEAST